MLLDRQWRNYPASKTHKLWSFQSLKGNETRCGWVVPVIPPTWWTVGVWVQQQPELHSEILSQRTKATEGREIWLQHADTCSKIHSIDINLRTRTFEANGSADNWKGSYSQFPRGSDIACHKGYTQGKSKFEHRQRGSDGNWARVCLKYCRKLQLSEGKPA